jgi:hypothetical protein
MTDDLAGLNTEYVQCRALLHAWDDIPYDGGAPRRWQVITKNRTILQFRCTRCGTLRYDVWSDTTGALIERAYRTPEGYALPKGRGRKVLVRREYLARLHSNRQSASRKGTARRSRRRAA